MIYLTSAIKELQGLDFFGWMCTAFMILAAVLAGAKLIGEFSKLIGKPVKWVKKKEEDHKLLTLTAQNLNKLQTRYDNFEVEVIKADKEIREDIDSLTKIFVDKQLDDMRYEILDFASAISLGRNYTKEQYIHTIKITDKYHKIITERGLENGEAEISTKLIKDSYEEKLKNGSFNK